MLGNIGPTALILIVVIALLLFGPNKLPELGRAFGRTLKEFKRGAKDVMADEEEDRKEIERSEDNRKDVNSKSDQDNRRLPD
jgi:sec-independent protein translocase protein TatA